jgi:hypothetical protein
MHRASEVLGGLSRATIRMSIETVAEFIMRAALGDD